jgi:hypothetical protein
VLGAPTPHSRDCAVPQRRVNASHRHRAPVSPHRLAAITWTSSLTRSGRRTGAVTTTSPTELPGRYVSSTIRTFSSVDQRRRRSDRDRRPHRPGSGRRGSAAAAPGAGPAPDHRTGRASAGRGRWCRALAPIYSRLYGRRGWDWPHKPTDAPGVCSRMFAQVR